MAEPPIGDGRTGALRRAQSDMAFTLTRADRPRGPLPGMPLRSSMMELSLDGGVLPPPREPIRLQDLGFRAAEPRWPTDVEMAMPGPRHIHPHESIVEPILPPSAQGPSEERVTMRSLVYCLQPLPRGLRCPLHYTDALRSPPTLEPFYHLQDADDTTLVFESRFESGNLEQATRTGAWSYELTLRKDLYTKRHTQWFYFSIRNGRAGQTYTLSITNMAKSDSLYARGMQPVVYSEVAARDGVGWRRAGENIQYFATSTRSNKPGYTLSFTYTVKYSNDIIYFAYSVPYTFGDLQRYIAAALEQPGAARRLHHRVLCKTMAGNACDLLTITSFDGSVASMSTRPAIVISARVHPGETNASWMMKGVLDFLLSDDPDAEVLRDSFLFKIVPMLNPDGVIVGNYRCNLAGFDLNRTYREPSAALHPTVLGIKTLMQTLVRERPVLLYVDLHGHSKNSGVFAYGCETSDAPAARFKERIFPAMLARIAEGVFFLDRCRFRMQDSKAGTGRIVGRLEHGLLNSLTIEASFCGPGPSGPLANRQFTPGDYEAVGASLCDALLDYCDPDQAKADLMLAEIRQSLAARLRAARGLASDTAVDLDEVDVDELLEGSSDGSDSCNEDNTDFFASDDEARDARERGREREGKPARRDSSASRDVAARKPVPPPRTELRRLHRRARSDEAKLLLGADSAATTQQPTSVSPGAVARRRSSALHMSTGNLSSSPGRPPRLARESMRPAVSLTAINVTVVEFPARF
eukprot:m.102459 g.102459  ORF g.102459 m.102459 type:complete len:752 (-) comp8825_c0_seq3:132-2387(-)